VFADRAEQGIGRIAQARSTEHGEDGRPARGVLRQAFAVMVRDVEILQNVPQFRWRGGVPEAAVAECIGKVGVAIFIGRDGKAMQRKHGQGQRQHACKDDQGRDQLCARGGARSAWTRWVGGVRGSARAPEDQRCAGQSVAQIGRHGDRGAGMPEFRQALGDAQQKQAGGCGQYAGTGHERFGWFVSRRLRRPGTAAECRRQRSQRHIASAMQVRK
jgi:hypothetical protein